MGLVGCLLVRLRRCRGIFCEYQVSRFLGEEVTGFREEDSRQRASRKVAQTLLKDDIRGGDGPHIRRRSPFDDAVLDKPLRPLWAAEVGRGIASGIR